MFILKDFNKNYAFVALSGLIKSFLFDYLCNAFLALSLNKDLFKLYVFTVLDYSSDIKFEAIKLVDFIPCGLSRTIDS